MLVVVYTANATLQKTLSWVPFGWQYPLPPPFHSTRPNAIPTPNPPVPTTEEGYYGANYTAQIITLIAVAIAIILSILIYKKRKFLKLFLSRNILFFGESNKSLF